MTTLKKNKNIDSSTIRVWNKRSDYHRKVLLDESDDNWRYGGCIGHAGNLFVVTRSIYQLFEQNKDDFYEARRDKYKTNYRHYFTYDFLILNKMNIRGLSFTLYTDTKKRQYQNPINILSNKVRNFGKK